MTEEKINQLEEFMGSLSAMMGVALMLICWPALPAAWYALVEGGEIVEGYILALYLSAPLYATLTTVWLISSVIAFRKWKCWMIGIVPGVVFSVSYGYIAWGMLRYG